jgi:hypothetical protein
MADADVTDRTLVNVRAELFGIARMVSGHSHVTLSVPERSYPRDLAVALAYLCPDLVGPVITDDRSGLHSSYTFNINGTSFVGDERVRLTPEDTVLLFSSQAGG